MPAITADTTTLPKLPARQVTERDRPVVSVTTAPSGFEGEGFPVRRAFAGVDLSLLDPFIHMDQMGEVDYAPYEPKGTDWHPHRGFETVTYIIDGTFQHQDSHGGGGVITNGATQWMTAGSGILHIETPPEELVVSGGTFHGVQLWVNLPSKDKMTAPRYQNLEGDQSALLSSPDGGALVRLIAGEVAGHVGPGSTHTPIAVAHATLAPGARLEIPWPTDFNALAYVLAGSGTVGAERRPVTLGQLDGVRRRRHADAGQPGRRRAAGGAAARRAAAPRAGRRLRPVRDEHPVRAGPGRRRLQRRPPRHHPRRRPAPLPALSGRHPVRDRGGPPPPPRSRPRCRTAARPCRRPSGPPARPRRTRR